MVTNRDKIKVALSASSDDTAAIRKLLHRVMQKAGMEVFDLEHLRNGQVAEILRQTHCSVHLLGNRYRGDRKNQQFSTDELQFRTAQQYGEPNEEFKIFVWQPTADTSAMDHDQLEFMLAVRNSVLHNTVYSKHESPVLLVEEIRSMLQLERKIDHKSKPCDVFLIHNQLDEQSGREIEEMLADILQVQRLSLEMKAGIQNIDPVADQILKSALTVVYFEKTIQWAVPFTQQIWRRIGGASSPTDLLLIADADVSANHSFSYDAPKVHPFVVSKDLAALEIKIQYDKMVGK